MVFVLHGNIESLYTRIVLVCAAEMGIMDTPAFEFRVVEWSQIFGSDESFDFDASPLKRVPWFEDTDNGIKLYESRSIAKYMAMKIRSPLIPDLSTPEAFALFDNACSIELGDFHQNCYPLCRHLFINPVFNNVPTDSHILSFFMTTFEKTLRQYERILSTQKFVAGDQLTIVDLFHVPFGYMAAQSGGNPTLAAGTEAFPNRLDDFVPIARPPTPSSSDVPHLPHVQRWWSTLTSLPSFKRINAEFEQSIVARLQKRK
ncbi:hypothetical protein IAR55_004234 [Kwoniella newhampshirensis]|uniref:glutathione transferase n=1 Tax=Kwoniella newhampshirensis TaxID=1651941 RepID=A0AAW0YXF9_9TREE